MSAGPVAALGWAEAIENILRCGFANVLRLGVATAALRRRNLWGRFPRVARLASAARTSQPGAEDGIPLGFSSEVRFTSTNRFPSACSD